MKTSRKYGNTAVQLIEQTNKKGYVERGRGKKWIQVIT